MIFATQKKHTDKYPDVSYAIWGIGLTGWVENIGCEGKYIIKSIGLILPVKNGGGDIPPLECLEKPLIISYLSLKCK